MKTERPVLIVIIPGFPKNEDDTSCLPAQQSFIRSLNRVHPLIEIVIVSLQYPFEPGEYQWHGLKVISMGGSNKGWFKKWMLRRKVQAVLTKLNLTYTITGILSFWYGECALAGSRFARRNNLPHHCWMMGQDAKAGNNYVRKVGLRPGELIAISDSIQQTFNNSYNITPKYSIPIGVDPTIFPTKSSYRSIDILCAGSLIPLKKFELAIRAISAARSANPNLIAVICGDGPERIKLQALIEKEGLQENVSLKGELPHQALLELMSQSRVLLHPSSYEGFSGVCLEAACAGMQVISFCKPMLENIPNWHTVFTTEEFADKTILLLKEPHDYSSVIPFPVERAAKRIIALYEL